MKPLLASTMDIRDLKRQIEAVAVAERVFEPTVLFALYRLGVFRELAQGARDLDALHAAVGGDAVSLRALLDGGVALKLLRRGKDGAYAAEGGLAECLGDPASPGYVGEWIELMHGFGGRMMRYDDVVREGRPVGPHAEGINVDPEAARLMTRAMDSYARSRGNELPKYVDLSGVDRLLDVGCGPGTYSMAVVEAFPRVRATLLDLPQPIAEARRLAAERGLDERLEFVASDAFDYAPDVPFDALLLSNVLHAVGPEDAPRLVRRCFDLLAPGGRVMVQAAFLDETRTGPRWPAVLNLILRLETGRGQNHTVGETRRWLEAAGFVGVEHVRFSLFNVQSCVLGRKPA